jgi:hypothetical protein
MHAIPILLATLARCAGIPLAAMSACWFALRHAEGQAAVQFRERLLLFESRAIATPAATAQHLLAHVDAGGRWK